MPEPVDQRGVQQGVAEKYLRAATIDYPDGNCRTFYVHKNAEGNILIDLATKFVFLAENAKAYFGLTYVDKKKQRRFLNNDIPIGKHVPAKDWNFTLAFKFYVPEPAELSDALCRHFLLRQCRRDVYEGRIQTDFDAQARLAAYVAQIEVGDYQPQHDYADYVKDGFFTRTCDTDFVLLVQKYHKQFSGQSPQEAELHFLNYCKNLPLYGCHCVDTKESKEGRTELAISANGLCTFEEGRGIGSRYSWPLIEKISFRRKYFCIKFLPYLPAQDAHLQGKSVVFKLFSSAAAERFYKLVIQHHEFFRLIKPTPKSKSSFFRRVSRRFLKKSTPASVKANNVDETVMTVVLDQTAEDDDTVTNVSSMLDRTQLSEEGSTYSMKDEGKQEEWITKGEYSVIVELEGRKLVKKTLPEEDNGDGKYHLLCADFDYDAELSRAILEATKLDPRMAVVGQIEVKSQVAC